MNSATQRTQNIKRSVQEYLDGAGLGVPIFYDESQRPLPTDGAWLDARWATITPTDMASPEKLQQWLLFLDCWSRLKSDEFGGVLDTLADNARLKFRDKWLPLYDYSDPASPVDTGFFIRLRITGDDPLPTTDLVRGRSLTVECSYIERS